MSVNTESPPRSLGELKRRFGDIILRAIDKIDPPADVKHAGTFREFKVLSSKAHAGEVRADLLIEETPDGKFSLGATLASWRGQDADKVVLNQQFQGGISGSLEGSGGQTMQSRLALTVDDELANLSGSLPGANYVMRLSVIRSDGSWQTMGIDPNARNRFRDEAQRRGLQPLTPIDPGLVSTFPGSSA